MATSEKRLSRTDLAGRRLTSSRALLFKLIQESRGHLDADELYRQAKAKEPRISLSTVYRALKLFKNLGLVEELHFDEEHHHYEAKPSTEHHHLICLSCGRVVEFQEPSLQEVITRVEHSNRFEVATAHMELTGYCSDCGRKKRAKVP